MEDEVFEGAFSRIERTYSVLFDNEWDFVLNENEREKQIRKILEEIWQDGYDKGLVWDLEQEAKP